MGDKPQKTESKPTSTRLTSLGKPRDLLLSVAAGPSKPKKVFTPNVNAVRNKNKAIPNLSSDTNRRNTKKQSKDFKKRDSEATRFVQSTGIFSEGSSEIKREAAYASRGSDGRDGGGEPSAGMEKPKIDTEAVWDIDLKEEAKVITDLLDYSHLEDEVEEDQYQPVVLPLDKNKENFFKTFAPPPQFDTKIKQEVDVKPNADDLSNNLNQCSFHKPELFSDTNVSYSIVKLPDSMPGRGFDEEGQVIDYTLDQMPEGQMGKIVVRQSGKMELVIGNMSYDLNSIEESPFMEELMVMPDQGATSDDATMVNMGAINEGFTISPSWQNLLLSEKPEK